jgi:AAA+ ATPase superfamily predicted ATPase
VVLDTIVAPQLDAFTGPIFEEICQQFLWRLGLAGGLPFLPLRIGSWWRANEEIDLIAMGQDTALFVECKWASRPVGVDNLRDLERKARLVSEGLDAQAQRLFCLCARNCFTL